MYNINNFTYHRIAIIAWRITSPFTNEVVYQREQDDRLLVLHIVLN